MSEKTELQFESIFSAETMLISRPNTNTNKFYGWHQIAKCQHVTIRTTAELLWCTGHASYTTRRTRFSGHWLIFCQQPQTARVYVSFDKYKNIDRQPQCKNRLLSPSCCVYETQIVEAPSRICRSSAIYYDLMISDSLILDFRKILHFIPPKPQCNVFSQFKPDIKMTPCKTIS